VIDVCTRGRKRGFCAVLATQRISKLNKDASAECNNKLIGRTGQDIDRKRAGDELGFTSKQDVLNLRNLKPGDFYAFGPAVSTDVKLVTVGGVSTHHPDIGRRSRKVTVPPPTKEVRKLLSHLNDLPKEREEELATVNALQMKVRELEKRLKEKPVVQGAQTVQGFTAQDLHSMVAEVMTSANERYAVVAKDIKKQLDAAYTNLQNAVDGLCKVGVPKSIDVKSPKMPNMPREKSMAVNFAMQYGHKSGSIVDAKSFARSASLVKHSAPVKVDFYKGALPAKKTPRQLMREETARHRDEELNLGRCEKMIVGFLAANTERSWSKEQVAAMIGYSVRSSGFANALSKLRSVGLLSGSGDALTVDRMATDGLDLPDVKYSVNNIRKVLGKCEGEIFNVLLSVTDSRSQWTQEELARETDSQYSVNSSGWANALSKLRTLGVIKKGGAGKMVELTNEFRELTP
jgi:hypothetical protein